MVIRRYSNERTEAAKVLQSLKILLFVTIEHALNHESKVSFMHANYINDFYFMCLY